jgi:hypothetical protein
MVGSLAPVMYLAVRTTRCRALCRAVSIIGRDATGPDALDGAAVDPLEDLGTHAKSFQFPVGEKVLSYHLHDCLGVFGP